MPLDAAVVGIGRVVHCWVCSLSCARRAVIRVVNDWLVRIVALRWDWKSISRAESRPINVDEGVGSSNDC